MMPDEDTDVQWVPRDSRDWIPVTWHQDQLTARMNVEYMEAEGLEARVGSQRGYYCVEVPVTQAELALTLFESLEGAFAPPMQEAGSQTSAHTSRLIVERYRAKTKASGLRPITSLSRILRKTGEPGVRKLWIAVLPITVCVLAGLAIWRWLLT